MTLAAVSQHVHSGGQDLVNNLQQKEDENRAMQMTAKYLPLEKTKAAKDYSELLTVKADVGNKFLDKKPAMDVTGMEKIEPIEAHEEKVSETKPEVPMDEEDRAMQLQMTARDKQIRTECSQLVMVVTAVDWEHAEDVQIQEAMTKVREWRTKGYSHIMRDFWEYERLARQWTPAQVRDKPGSEYANLKVYMEDFHRQLGNAIHTVDKQDSARKLGTLELIAWAELLNVHKDLIWETKPKDPMDAGLKTKHEASIFITRRISFPKKGSEKTAPDKQTAVTTGECNDDPGGGLANHNI